MNTILIGFKSCGKTSVGKLLAEKLQQKLIDTDRLIEAHYLSKTNRSLTTREIYQATGEVYFRELETSLITSLEETPSAIIATGGGSLLNSKNAEHLKKIGKLVYLKTPLNILISRITSGEQPAFLNVNNLAQEITALYEKRISIYEQIADYQVLTEGKSIDIIATQIHQEVINGK